MDGIARMKRYKRLISRKEYSEHFACWKEGYTFFGKANKELDYVQEYSHDGKVIRIHYLSNCEELPE